MKERVDYDKLAREGKAEKEEREEEQVAAKVAAWLKSRCRSKSV